ncbi:MAG: 4-hydroxy-3-methylbut-2-enyl diphosphate reductase [Treponema sp.]|nr:4-hydroxy-3-methylbut-2-enyl diphosphate reductase [Treponema sp.]
MKVIKAQVLGFCMGVRRAVDLTIAEAQRAAKKNTPVYTLGELIHNPKVLGDLSALGVSAVKELPENCGYCSVVIRAHGIDPAAEKSLREKDCHIVDATCPNVKVSQLTAEEFIRAGYCLFIAGETSHAEIIGIMGYAVAAEEGKRNSPFFCEVIGNVKEAGKAAKKLYSINNNAKTALLGQTTISEKEYDEIGEAVRLFFPNLEIIQTICSATKERQNALRELLEKADAVIIAGGKESANTQHLLVIAKESGKPCALAEDSSQIPKEFLKYETIGLCAGASTPDSIIEEIEDFLGNF